MTNIKSADIFMEFDSRRYWIDRKRSPRFSFPLTDSKPAVFLTAKRNAVNIGGKPERRSCSTNESLVLLGDAIVNFEIEPRGRFDRPNT